MKVKQTYTFIFSKEEVDTIHKMWEFMSNMEECDYLELFCQAGCKDFFDDLDNLLIFAEEHME